ncbi:MAG: TRAP transporter small permease [Desulfofustis sp.]|nr:TRAP transporter small permease [Desulfofustis sp.]
MRKFLDTLYLASGWLAAFCIAAIAAIVVIQVSLNLIDRASTLFRGTAVGLTIPSYADFTGFFLAAASFLALAHTFRQGEHIRVTILIGHLPKWFAWAFEFWCVAAATVVSCYFTWYTGILVGESYRFNDLSPGMIAVPLWIPQTAMLIGLIILSIALIDEFVGLLRGKRPAYLDSGVGLLVGEAYEEDSPPDEETEQRRA